jgi:deoxyribonuclease-4
MSMVRRLGVHTSITGGLHKSLVRACALGCNTVQLFSHNPRGWAVPSISKEEIFLFKSFRAHFGISPVYIHASYLINIASKDINIKKRSIDLLIIEMERADAIGADYVILHLGSASGVDRDRSMRRAIGALNKVAQRNQWKAGLLIENTAGDRGDIFSTIKDLSEVMNGVTGTLIGGVCVDTCHAFAAGYNISNQEGTENILEEIRTYIGFDKIKLIHLNDSKGDVGSGIDRHEHIGLGKIGTAGLKRFINHTPFRAVPLILETPKKRESDDYENLRRVQGMIRP